MNFICQAVSYAGIYKCQNDTNINSKFAEHVSQYGLSYGTKEEYDFRYQQFLRNDAEILRINA